MNCGMLVVIIFESGEKVELRNITEIHYKYPSVIKYSMQVAFESDIHQTGSTFYLSQVKEFYTLLETGIEEEL